MYIARRVQRRRSENRDGHEGRRPVGELQSPTPQGARLTRRPQWDRQGHDAFPYVQRQQLGEGVRRVSRAILVGSANSIAAGADCRRSVFIVRDAMVSVSCGWWNRKKLIKTINWFLPSPLALTQDVLTLSLGIAADTRDCCHRVHIDRWKLSRRELNWLIKKSHSHSVNRLLHFFAHQLSPSKAARRKIFFFCMRNDLWRVNKDSDGELETEMEVRIRNENQMTEQSNQSISRLALNGKKVSLEGQSRRFSSFSTRPTRNEIFELIRFRMETLFSARREVMQAKLNYAFQSTSNADNDGGNNRIHYFELLRMQTHLNLNQKLARFYFIYNAAPSSYIFVFAEQLFHLHASTWPIFHLSPLCATW